KKDMTKDQLLEISPMALRLSRQSSCKGFDEHPLRRHRAFTDPEGPMNIRMTRTYLLFTISYRTGSHPAKSPGACKLLLS
ncbi:hypothetical protein, partial [Phyllobacterium pellucidum]|uniref:hypothetical protein n=1 Tax=Phyllobacterium pellucidum TaxID=2740464 RepID=UPI001A9BF65E